MFSKMINNKTLKITFIVMSYWTISISMVFANKYLVGEKTDNQDYTIFVAWVQCIVTVLFVIGLKSAQRLVSWTQGIQWQMDFSYNAIINILNYMYNIFWTTTTFVSMLTFNNLCLKHVGIAFYQVARSMTLIFTIIFSVTILRKTMSIKVLLCCFCVVTGFSLGIDQENIAGTLSLHGVIFGVITSIFVALNGIFIKSSMEVVGHNPVCLTLYNNLNACFLFLPLVIGTGQLQNFIFSSRITDYFFWLFLLSSGCLSFAIAWISALQIDVTSPVTHHISANAKAVLQTLISVLYTHDYKPLLWWISIFLVVGGALSYAVITFNEHKYNVLSEDDDKHISRENKVNI